MALRQAILKVKVDLEVKVRMSDCLPDEARCNKFWVELWLIRDVFHHFEDGLRYLKNKIDYILFLSFGRLVAMPIFAAL